MSSPSFSMCVTFLSVLTKLKTIELETGSAFFFGFDDPEDDVVVVEASTEVWFCGGDRGGEVSWTDFSSNVLDSFSGLTCLSV